MRSFRPAIEIPGVIEAIQRAQVHAEIGALLKKIHFSPGADVKQGDLLAELDDSQYQTLLAAARAELQAAEANVEQARTNWTRARELRPKGSISELEYDKAKAALGVAEAAVAKAKAQVDRAELDVKHTRLYAPFDGRISKARYAVGDFVDPGNKPNSKALCELVQLDPIYATSSVEQGQFNQFENERRELEQETGERLRLNISLKLAGDVDYPHEGEFESWSYAYAATSGTIKGRSTFPNPDGQLRPGQNVTVVTAMPKPVKRILVPQAAVAQDQQGRFVMVVGEDDTVQRRDLILGIRFHSDWAVMSGLEEGERVITQGAQMLRPGTKVSITKND